MLLLKGWPIEVRARRAVRMTSWTWKIVVSLGLASLLPNL
mgnify:CR=1 FL=1